MNNTETNSTEGWNEINEDDNNISKFKKLQKRLKEDPEFRKQFENKGRKVNCMMCLIRIFCCPCIALWNLTKI